MAYTTIIHQGQRHSVYSFHLDFHSFQKMFDYYIHEHLIYIYNYNFLYFFQWVLPSATPHTDMPGNHKTNILTVMNPALNLAYPKSGLTKNPALNWPPLLKYKPKPITAFWSSSPNPVSWPSMALLVKRLKKLSPRPSRPTWRLLSR